MNKTQCFRIGDLYRDMSSGTGVARHELSEWDHKKLFEAFSHIIIRGRLLRDEFFPEEKSLSEIISLAESLAGHVRWLEQNVKRPTKKHVAEMEAGITELTDLIENDFFAVAYGSCE